MTGLKHLARAAAVLVSLAVTAPAAHAQFFGPNPVSGCGGTYYVSCATWHAALSPDNKTLTLTVTNTSGAAPASNSASVFTQILLGNLNSSITPSGFSASGSGNWSGGGGGLQICGSTDQCGMTGAGFLGSGFGANAHGNDGLGAGQTATFTFTFANAVSSSDFNGVQLAFHDQSQPNGCLTNKFVANGSSGVAASGSASPSCIGFPTTSTPEPETASLLGLGLSAIGGLSGLGRLRRRRAANA
jgi:hypothetical protein